MYEFVHNLNWTHIRRLLSVVNPEARMWYLKNASEEMWSTTTLDRNISSLFDESQLEQALIEKMVIAKIGMDAIKVLIK